MTDNVVVSDAKVMSKGQVTIPKNIREVLGVDTGDRVTFVVEDGKIVVMNSAVYALLKIQSEMKGEASRLGLQSEDDVVNLIKQIRKEKK
jgi:AbrB family looped-hinge helix DNA binding protein